MSVVFLQHRLYARVLRSRKLGEAAAVEKTLLSQALTKAIPINDVAEAAALAVLARRAADRIDLGSTDATAEDRIVALIAGPSVPPRPFVLVQADDIRIPLWL